MEFIDGEDLGSLLRRIGQLPAAKALEIARKLCAGLSAAHDKGVVHRDLKPSNIMVDSRGQMLITDFGLAVAAAEPSIPDCLGGTPAYMSPEQLSRVAATPRCDLYALGIVLYEMFTGRHPFEARARRASPPPMKDVDPAIEHIVSRCLSAEPGGRPETALAVAAALPGGDPVAAALAAGETPSPEQVANGYDSTALKSITTESPADARRQLAAGRPLGVLFRYRASPLRMVPQAVRSYHVSQTDPPFDVSGMATVHLDPQGRLRYLRVIPLRQSEGSDKAYPCDWRRVLEFAGPDIGAFTPADPTIVPPQAFDERRAWVEKDSSTPIRVEAAAWHGRPVWFTTISSNAGASLNSEAVKKGFGPDTASRLFFLSLTVATSLLAFRNLKFRRGDSRGALKLAAAGGALSVTATVLSQSAGLDQFTYAQVVTVLSKALYLAFTAGAGYLALEPFIRRRWPGLLVSWTRCLAGHFRNPLIGRDVLLGLLAGSCLGALAKAHDAIYGPAAPMARPPDVFGGATAGSIVSQLAYSSGVALPYACWVPFLLVVGTVVLRRRWLAMCAVALLFTALNVTGSAHPALTIGIYLPFNLLLSVLTLRCFGLLGVFAALWIISIGFNMPLTADTSAWYFGGTLTAITAVVAVGYWNFRTAVAGRRISWVYR